MFVVPVHEHPDQISQVIAMLLWQPSDKTDLHNMEQTMQLSSNYPDYLIHFFSLILYKTPEFLPFNFCELKEKLWPDNIRWMNFRPWLLYLINVVICGKKPAP